MGLYYIKTGLGCGIRRAESIEECRRETLKEVGTHFGLQVCRKATKGAWIGRVGRGLFLNLRGR